MTTPEIDFKNTGRNDPCPCGSGKKYKKCHQAEAASVWQGNVAPVAAEGTGENAMPQFDPSKMDLNWLAEFSSAIQKLPKGQLARLQSLMQKTMGGKDVGRELEEFQRTLPLSIQELLKKSPEFNTAQAQAGANEPQAELTEDQKEKLREIQKNNNKSGFSSLWNKFRKKS